MRPLRVGARESPLSRWQAERIRRALEAGGHPTTFVGITTRGDRDRTTPLGQFGEQAIFSRELDDALLEGRIDLGVHSLKDLPTALPAGIVLAAVGEREDPRDALVSRGGRPLRELAPGATVATSSLRRRAQLLRARPDLCIVELRGNVETRLATLFESPGRDAIVLAVAGLVRLGLTERIAERFALELMLPAPGQGALAVTAREADEATRAAARDVAHDPAAALATTAERALLAALHGGCHVPVSALGTAGSGSLRLMARVTSPDGRHNVEAVRVARIREEAAARRLGEDLAGDLLAGGADRILAGLSPGPGAGAP